MRKRDLNICCVVSSIQAQAVGSEEQTLNGKGHQGRCLRGRSLSWRMGLSCPHGERCWRNVKWAVLGSYLRWPSAPLTAYWVPYLLGVENQACFNLGGDGRWLV